MYTFFSQTNKKLYTRRSMYTFFSFFFLKNVFFFWRIRDTKMGKMGTVSRCCLLLLQIGVCGGANGRKHAVSTAAAGSALSLRGSVDTLFAGPSHMSISAELHASGSSSRARSLNRIHPDSFTDTPCQVHAQFALGQQALRSVLRMRGGYRDSDIVRHYILIMTPPPKDAEEHLLLSDIKVHFFLCVCACVHVRACV